MHVHVFWLYPIIFMSYLCKCMCECFEIIGVCFLVNLLSLEKLNVLVLETGFNGFCGFADKTS
jgi:hypothetical protein